MNTLKHFARRLCAALLCLAMVNSAMADVVTYFHNDISGSPQAATDAAGNLLWKENYKPYGEKLNRAPASAGNKIGFHGKAFDDGTGLSYMGARYYDPVLGRFMGVDPVDYQEDNLHSFNRYAYANNNPYKYVDPTGEYAFLIPMAVYALTALSAALTISSAMNGFSQQSQGDVSIGPLAFPGQDISSPNNWNIGAVHAEQDDTLSKDRIEHGEKRAEQAKTDSHRQVGDKNRVVETGKRYLDNDSGHNVHVSGDRVVITDQHGNTVSQFKNTRKNTNSRVQSGRWIPQD